MTDFFRYIFFCSMFFFVLVVLTHISRNSVSPVCNIFGSIDNLFGLKIIFSFFGILASYYSSVFHGIILYIGDR